MKLRSRLLAVISAVIGLALFVYVIKQTGVAEIWARIGSLGFGFLLILSISSSRYLSRSAAWLREELHRFGAAKHGGSGGTSARAVC